MMNKIGLEAYFKVAVIYLPVTGCLKCGKKFEKCDLTYPLCSGFSQECDFALADQSHLGKSSAHASRLSCKVVETPPKIFAQNKFPANKKKRH